MRPSATHLTATARLGVLDELGVPYERGGDAADAAWSALSARDASGTLHWLRARELGTAGRYTHRGSPLWAHVADDASVARLVRSIGGEWVRSEPVLDAAGRPHASIWRSRAGGTVFPFDPDEAVHNYRSEGYRSFDRGPGRRALAPLRRAYYLLRPAVPRAAQIAMRRAFTRVQQRSDFPRWPVETALHDLCDLVLEAVADAAGAPVPYVAPWPEGRTWALVLTHDVETAAGRDGIERLRSLERRSGFSSSWNLVPERYAVPDELVARLAADGGEVGVHGLRHDGRDLASRRTLARRLPAMRRWAGRWGAVGFRSPATHRVWDWMPELGFDYDSSYPDTDPYEPIPGGCCSWLPFFNRDLVELPITLPQDHTVLTILRRDESLWLEKAEALRRRGGMALLIVHPDYMLGDAPLAAYGRFLERYRGDATAWHALPREVSAWWRRRAATSICAVDGGWMLSGPAADEARIAYAVPSADAAAAHPDPAALA